MIELMLPPFVACMVLVAIHSYLGLHVIAREVIFVDLSLAQMAALGTTTGLLLHVAPDSHAAQLLALAFTAIGAALFAATRTRGRGRVPQEAIIGIVYAVAAAASVRSTNCDIAWSYAWLSLIQLVWTLASLIALIM